MQIKRPRVAAIGLDDSQIKSIGPLCGDLRTAHSVDESTAVPGGGPGVGCQVLDLRCCHRSLLLLAAHRHEPVGRSGSVSGGCGDCDSGVVPPGVLT